MEIVGVQEPEIDFKQLVKKPSQITPEAVSKIEASLNALPFTDDPKIFDERAKIRNSLRSWDERNSTIAKILEDLYIPPVSAEEIRAEEIAKHRQRIGNLVRGLTEFGEQNNRVQGVRPPRRMNITQVYEGSLQRAHKRFINTTNHSADTLKREEFAKYVNVKLQRLLDDGKIYQARNMVNYAYTQVQKEAPNSLLADEDSDLIQEAVQPTIVKKLNELLAAKDVRFFSAFLELGFLTRFSVNDFAETAPDALHDPEFQTQIAKELAIQIAKHPEIYCRVRDGLGLFGILDPEAMDSHPEIRKGVHEHLLSSARIQPAAYKESGLLLEKYGLITFNENIHQRPEIQAAFKELLLKYLKGSSPYLYASLRKKLGNEGFIDENKMDQLPEVRTIAWWFLQQAQETHPKFGQRIGIVLERLIGIEPLEPSPEEKKRPISFDWFNSRNHYLYILFDQVAPNSEATRFFWDKSLRDFVENGRAEERGFKVFEQEDLDTMNQNYDRELESFTASYTQFNTRKRKDMTRVYSPSSQSNIMHLD